MEFFLAILKEAVKVVVAQAIIYLFSLIPSKKDKKIPAPSEGKQESKSNK